MSYNYFVFLILHQKQARKVHSQKNHVNGNKTNACLYQLSKQGTAPVDTRHDEEYAGTFGSAFPQATKPKDHCSFVLFYHLVKVASLLIMK